MIGDSDSGGVLAPFGLDGLGHRVYRALLRGGEATGEELATALDADPAGVGTRLDVLARLGLVTLADGRAAARAPRLALGRLADGQARWLRDREEQLNALRQSIPAFLAEEGAQHSEQLRGEIELIGVDRLVPVLEQLVRGTSGEMLFVHTREWQRTDAARTRSDVAITAEELSGRHVRSIYPVTALEDADLLAELHRWAADGEQIRLHPDPPSRLSVFVGEAALVPAEWGRRPAHRVVVRSPGLVELAAAYFEQLWSRATPLPGTAGHDDRTVLLSLLAAGAKDETIARYLKLSLRTVRRRIAALMEELDAPTRFVAGIEAARRGWI